MKVDDILQIDKTVNNRAKAAMMRADIAKKSRDNNPRQGSIMPTRTVDSERGPMGGL
jgi:hypothetical protein